MAPVIEVPPVVLGILNDAWQRFVGNMGVTGPMRASASWYDQGLPAIPLKAI